MMPVRKEQRRRRACRPRGTRRRPGSCRRRGRGRPSPCRTRRSRAGRGCRRVTTKSRALAMSCFSCAIVSRVERRLAVGIDRRGHAADEEALQVRVLAAEHGVHLDELALPVERLEVVRHRHQVGFGRQPVGRVSPVGVGERSELAAIDERLDAIADAGEVLRARQRPVRDRLGERRGLRRIGRERRHDVDPVERVQVVEVDDVVLHACAADDQVAQQPRVGRRRGADRVLDGADRRDRVHRRAHAADPLRERPGVARIAALAG